MANQYRNIYCGEVSKKNVGKEVRIAGWIESIRNLGGLLFITVRDETGVVQIISNNPDEFKDVTRESTITVLGKVKERTPDMINKNMKTGEIEIEIISYEILGKCSGLFPFEVNRSKDSSEETRLKYRYLDLRNKENHERMLFRSRVIDGIRNQMKELGFTEFTTPIITTSSPEGATSKLSAFATSSKMPT